MRKKIGITILMAVLLGIISVSQMTGERLLKLMKEKEIAETAGNAEELVVVVDSGHGGKDPGKIGINNALEKDINLQIAKKVQKFLKKEKIKVIMTRENEGSLSESKVEDLKARVDIINKTKPALAVSIHQNSYPEESVHGAQVFYFTHSEKGEAAAKIIQESLCSIDSENHRQIKANDTYYMLRKTEVPVVIVECGFLSNTREAELLCDDSYQASMAKAIVEGILRYVSEK